jgi:hypothetical protein
LLVPVAVGLGAEIKLASCLFQDGRARTSDDEDISPSSAMLAVEAVVLLLLDEKSIITL